MPILGVVASSTRQGQATDTGSYFPIGLVTVGSAGAASITFSSIPQTYTHLQIRGIAKSVDISNDRSALKVEFNSDTGNNYARHLIGGNGSSEYYDSVASSTARAGARVISSYVNYANMFTTYIIDILDYANTNKRKTVRTLGGFDTNGGSFQEIVLGDFMWENYAAITSINLLSTAGNLAQYSQLALYGIKGA